MRLGIIARSDNTGLGNQTRELVNMLNPDKILLINSSFFNQNEQHPEWYAGYDCITTDRGFPRQGEVKAFLQNLDVVISCETFYSQQLVDMARMAGIKTILQYNYEFLGNLQHEDWSLPDVLLAPSTWHINDIKNLYGDRCEVIHLPPPTDAELFKDIRNISDYFELDEKGNWENKIILVEKKKPPNEILEKLFVKILVKTRLVNEC